MPKDFNQCVKRGGRVRRKSTGNNYQNFCFDSKGSHAGDVKRKKTKSKGRKR